MSDDERFTEGDCHLLAGEIHRLTGWPVCALHAGRRIADTHAFVLAPGRRAIDVRGVRDVRTLIREWRGEGAVGYVRAPEIVVEWGQSFTGSKRRARVLAKKLVALAAVSPADTTPEGGETE